MKKLLTRLLLLGVIVAAAGLWLTRPKHVDENNFNNLIGDAEHGEMVLAAAGCVSCHSEPESESETSLAGGRRFETPFGTFVAPNIYPAADTGLKGWTQSEFASAVLLGSSPDNSHYYPAFPYSSYAKMTAQDVADLWAYMSSLPAVERANEPHEIGFPFNIRLSLGGWKLLFFNDDWVADADTPELERGRYLVEALGHCAECHTPRNALGGLNKSEWMMGAPNPSGKGHIPGIAPAVLDWSAGDIAYYLETGFTPDFDSAGGEMTEVIRNTSRLTPEDRAAIAAYLKALQ